MKLTIKEKTLLENKIYNLIKESFNENDFFENGFFEKEDEDDDDNEEYDEWDDDDDDSWDEEESEDEKTKRELIVKWLDTAQELHSVLAYKLYPKLASKGENGKGTARSKFSQKYRHYKNKKFSPKEINILYNLRSDFISKGSLNKD